MKIANFDFNEGLCLAPMAGVSDVGFRKLCSRYGADATWSEMLSARAMLHNSEKTELMTVISQEEKIKVGQIFGHEPEVMAKAIKNPLLRDFDIIDINMGCPAPKIVRNGEGSALMKDLPLASKIISECVKASERPVAVKFRLGYDKDISTQFGRMCEESGASFITLHARTTMQGYSGNANYDAIAKLKASVNIQVIGNGDVVDTASYKEMLSTGVDGVMLGRATQGRPWLFSVLKGGNKPQNSKIFEDIKLHIETLRKYYREDWLVLYMRKHLLWYTSELPNARDIRPVIATSPSIDESLKILERIYS